MNCDFEKGLIPAFVVVTLGTTGLCAYDDLDGVAKAVRHRSEPQFFRFCIRKNVDREFEEQTSLKIWIHVDAAYGGPLFWIPEKRQYLNGIHLVDSINTNLSKVGLAGFVRDQK